MQISEYYIDLRFAYPTISEHTPFSVTISEMADIFYCTTRNARHLIKKMDTAGFITWKPGRGRGRQSQITFLLSLNTVIILHFQDLLQQEKFEQALQFISREEIPADIRKTCYNQLRPQFGLQHPITTDPKRNHHKKTKGMTLNHIVRQVKGRTTSWMIEKKSLKHSLFRWPKSK